MMKNLASSNEKEVYSQTSGKKRILTIKETAKLYGFPEYTLRRLIRENRIPCIRSGNRAYINPRVFEAFLEKGGELYDKE